jgi:adenylate cyclase
MIYIDLFYPLISLILSLVAVEAIAFSIQEKSGKFLKDTFSSYLSGDLLQELIDNPDSFKLGGEKKELSILFSDIRGFTTISENLEPEELIQVLNRYFTPMTKSVLENKGMLDKYIGDAVMAFFNAPVDVKEHADAACRCAISMIAKLEALNLELKNEVEAKLKLNPDEETKKSLEVFRDKILPIRIGVGLNTAEVIVGNIGSDDKKEYTIIGDGVNLASRVESLTKGYGVPILITEFTIAKMKSNFLYREMEPVKVKGKDEAVILYELMADTEVSKTIKEEYDKALQIYKDGNLQDSKIIFSTLVDKYDDSPSKHFLKYINENRLWAINKMQTK